MFTTMGGDRDRAARFGGAMMSLTGGEGYEPFYVIDNYDWKAINDQPGGGLIVDIGGSHGFICIELAKKFSNLKFVVQDLQRTIDSAPVLDGELKERVSFMVHDFHTLQPIKGADSMYFSLAESFIS
jgi:hypothetical protein